MPLFAYEAARKFEPLSTSFKSCHIKTKPPRQHLHPPSWFLRDNKESLMKGYKAKNQPINPNLHFLILFIIPKSPTLIDGKPTTRKRKRTKLTPFPLGHSLVLPANTVPQPSSAFPPPTPHYNAGAYPHQISLPHTKQQVK